MSVMRVEIKPHPQFNSLIYCISILDENQNKLLLHLPLVR